jgi:hypothetical protein
MKKSKVFIVCLAVFLAITWNITGCNPKTTDDTTSAAAAFAQWCQQTANNIKNVQPGEIPDYLTTGDSVKTGQEWDVNAYFAQFKHLSLENGYVLDYVYDFNGSAGSPVLYMRPAKAAPYKTIREFSTAAGEFTRPENDISAVWFTAGETSGISGNKIKLDGTKEGYFEYTVLQLLGSQFYLFWHANYNDTEIICEKTALEAVLASIGGDSFGEPVDNGFKEKARRIDFQPMVEISGDLATVQVLVFSKWGGFSRLSFTMYKNYPHMMIGFEEESLLEYQCGVLF